MGFLGSHEPTCSVNVHTCLCLGNCLRQSFLEGQSGLSSWSSLPFSLPASVSVNLPSPVVSEAAARVVSIKFPMAPCWLLNTVQSFKQMFRDLMICTDPLPLFNGLGSIAAISACCMQSFSVITCSIPRHEEVPASHLCLPRNAMPESKPLQPSRPSPSGSLSLSFCQN